jgi:hypothetical protein
MDMFRQKYIENEVIVQRRGVVHYLILLSCGNATCTADAYFIAQIPRIDYQNQNTCDI